MDAPNKEFVLAGSLEELKAKGRLVVHGRHRPILVIYDRGRVFALDNRCPHMGFPLERGSVEDGILTCHWHHARFDLESGCTFDLWADDVPICPVEVRNGDVWVKTTFDHADPTAHWRSRLADGLAHDLGLVIAKAVHGQLAADVPRADIVRQVALFGAQNRDGWGVGLTILTALANLLSALPEEEAYLALFHGARRVAADCDGEAPRRERAPLGSRPDPAALKRWLRRWTNVRHREAAERTLLTAGAAGFSPAELADALFAAETDCRQLVERGKAQFDSPEGQRVAEFWRTLYAEGLAPKEKYNGDAFAEGKSAMSIVGPWAVAVYGDKVRWGAVPVPTSTGRPAGQTKTFSDAKNVAMYSACRNRGTAWDVLKFATSKEQDGKLLETTGQMPLREDLSAAYPEYFTKNPDYKGFADQAARTVEVPNVPNSIAIWQTFRDAWSKSVIFGRQDPGAALDEAAQKVDQLAKQS